MEGDALSSAEYHTGARLREESDRSAVGVLDVEYHSHKESLDEVGRVTDEFLHIRLAYQYRAVVLRLVVVPRDSKPLLSRTLRSGIPE